MMSPPPTNHLVSEIKQYLLGLQNNICNALAAEDGGSEFASQPWSMDGFGSGITRTMTNSTVIEKGGVNFSHVQGDALPAPATQNRPHLAGCRFQAMGVSLVIHPNNPYVPTSHANVRFFIAEPEKGDPIWWFGGGFDLTPYYGFEEDCVHWHRVSKQACAPLGGDAYPRFKAWCDDYFYLKHRDEPRGIGGLFFDDLNEPDFNTCYSFMKSVGDHYIQAYAPIIARRKNTPFGEREKQFQRYRRGRYVEFNLLYDRGTLFGLQTKGRTEAILMSMPPEVNWIYNWAPPKGSEEERLYQTFLVAKEWV